jgi:hypothetical protein
MAAAHGDYCCLWNHERSNKTTKREIASSLAHPSMVGALQTRDDSTLTRWNKVQPIGMSAATNVVRPTALVSAERRVWGISEVHLTELAEAAAGRPAGPAIALGVVE